MQGRWLINLVLLVVIAAVGVGQGCSAETRRKVLTTVFEDVPPAGQKESPKPYVRQPRRPPPYQPPPPHLVPVKAYKPDFDIDWKALLFSLPKDDVGGIDWVRALAGGQIDPQAGVDAANSQASPVLDLDVHLEPKDLPLFKVTFPHKPHTDWLACAECHPKYFQMQAGADPITMGKIFAGEYCGQCHGKVAFDVSTACPRCHLALAGPK